jgi:serine protease
MGVRLAALALAAALLALALAACGDGVVPGTGSGTVAGEVKVGVGDVSPSVRGEAPLEPRSAGPALRAAGTGEPTPFVPGELIVAFEPSVQAASLARLSVAGQTLEAVRPLAAEGTHLYRTSAATLDEALALAAALVARPDVRYAHPNYLVFPALAPDDPEYDRQWHYGAIDLEGAWDVTTGSPDVVVAVIDTGILYRQGKPSDSHPDLAGRVLPGYDFITRTDIADDGDGRDPDPYDTVPDNGYHGTHVAGTVGAATDNGLGVAGVDWRARLLPVRVLGKGGGALSDLADAIYWSVGGSVPGVPANPYPADVVNLSLGVRAAVCYDALYEALDYAASRAVVVAAAGNYAEPASGFTPANCPGPIVVGATERHGERAWYSNYGSRIDVMAPGGDMTSSAADGVLSLGPGSGYAYMEGTSMAAPHVSGVAALMRALDPGLTTADALDVLRAGATPLTNAECEAGGVPERALYGFDCGAGLIDARSALETIASGEPPPPPPPVEGVELSFDPPILDLGAQQADASFTVTNVGDETAEWEFTAYDYAADNPGPVPFGVVSVDDDDASGVLAPGESHVVDIHIDRSFLEADGFYVIQPVFVAGGEEFLYDVRFTKVSEPAPSVLKGPMVVAALKEDPAGVLYVSGSESSDGVIASFEFPVESGQNLLTAWSDENDNGDVDEGDFLGYHPRWVNVPPGGRVSGVDVSVLPVGGGVVPEGMVEALEAARRVPGP